MLSSKLIFCLVLYGLHVTTDAKVINFRTYDVEDEFKEAIENLSKAIGDAVNNALKDLEILEKDVVGVGAMDLYGLSLVFDREEKASMEQLSELENENNKECIGKARNSLKEIRAELEAQTEVDYDKLKEENQIVAQKSKASVREHLKVPDGFVTDFDACSDDECRRRITESVLAEITVTPERVDKLYEDAKSPLWDLIYKFENYVFNSILVVYRNQSVTIVEDVKKCDHK